MTTSRLMNWASISWPSRFCAASTTPQGKMTFKKKPADGQDAHGRACLHPLLAVDHADERLGDPPQQHIDRRGVDHEQGDGAVEQVLWSGPGRPAPCSWPERRAPWLRHDELVGQPGHAFRLVEKAQKGGAGELAQNQVFDFRSQIRHEVIGDDLEAVSTVLAHGSHIQIESQLQRGESCQPDVLEQGRPTDRTG